jgi:O-acetylhomoserine/O-acetylserine sulfhydrylase-like pyridoxal-dependent enzyme
MADSNRPNGPNRPRFSTDCAHAGDDAISSQNQPAVMPIYQTSVYDFPDLDVVDNVWEGKQSGYIYGRYGLSESTPRSPW